MNPRKCEDCNRYGEHDSEIWVCFYCGGMLDDSVPETLNTTIGSVAGITN